MSQQINSRAVVKLTQWPTEGYAPVTCVMILNDNVKLKTIMDNDDTQANYKKTMIDYGPKVCGWLIFGCR